MLHVTSGQCSKRDKGGRIRGCTAHTGPHSAGLHAAVGPQHRLRANGAHLPAHAAQLQRMLVGQLDP